MPTIIHKPVESSNIATIGYDQEKKALHIGFKNGTVYSYADVSPEVHQALFSAESLGKHFHQHVKSKYKFTKLK